MKYTVERIFSNLKKYECLGWSYQNFDEMLKDLVYQMRHKIGHPFIGEEYRNLRFFMNIPLYREFSISCKMSDNDSDMYRGIPIIADPSLLYVGDTPSSDGIVRLVYEESGAKRYSRYYDFWTDQSKIENTLEKSYCVHDNYKFSTAIKDRHCEYYLSESKAKPHIDHVKFNGPATIVFWKDGTKTVVKHDGKGRKDRKQAILYAFIRKIYGEGKPYHNILNEIEEAVK